MNRTLFCLIPVLVFALMWPAAVHAGGPVIPRQVTVGTLIVVSNQDRSEYEDLMGTLRPKYLIWVDPATPRDSVRMPPERLAMVLFLLKATREGVGIDASWEDELPVSAGSLAFGNTMIAAKTIHPPGEKWYASVLVMAPTDTLLRMTLREALSMRQFPLGKPITHDLADMRHVRAMACLPSVAAAYLGAIAGAAEASLYRELIDLRAFHVVGREAMPIASAQGGMTLGRLQELGRDLDVQAVAFVEITSAETVCEEHSEYKKSNKKGVSSEHRRKFNDIKNRYEATHDKPFPKQQPSPDLVWAAAYEVREYTTTVTGEIKILDVATGRALVACPIAGKSSFEEEDDVYSHAYRWYKIDHIGNSEHRHDRDYEVRLRQSDALTIVREQVSGFGEFLAGHAMLPVPGEDFVPSGPVLDAQDVVARILSADEGGVFIDLGSERGIRKGDMFSLWGKKDLRDPDSGDIIETITIRMARLRVAKTYEKTSYCDVVEGTADRSWIGLTVVMD